jgi:carbon storage regulator
MLVLSACHAGVRSFIFAKESAMLVLSRKRDESIFIGENIKIKIVDIRGDKVRLGIEAPSEIPVHRQEVHEAIQREQQRLAKKPAVAVPGTPVVEHPGVATSH